MSEVEKCPRCPHALSAHDELANGSYGGCWLCSCRGEKGEPILKGTIFDDDKETPK